MSQTKYDDQFIDYLLGLKQREDRGALAALRSGIDKHPGEASRMFPYVGRFLTSSDPSRASVITIFLTASLFAKHPEHAPGRSLGLALWYATKREANPDGKHGADGVEARFAAMLDAHEEDLPRHLEGLLSLCESGGSGLDWYQLRRDLSGLLGDDAEWRDRTRLRWARDFWQGDTHESTAATSEGPHK